MSRCERVHGCEQLCVGVNRGKPAPVHQGLKGLWEEHRTSPAGSMGIMTSCYHDTAWCHLLEICPVLQQIVFKQKSETQPSSPNCSRDGEWKVGVM